MTGTRRDKRRVNLRIGMFGSHERARMETKQIHKSSSFWHEVCQDVQEHSALLRHLARHIMITKGDHNKLYLYITYTQSALKQK